MTTNYLASIALILILAAGVSAETFELIADDTNEYSTTVGNIVIQQPNFQGGSGGLNGIITIDNGSFIIQGQSFSQLGGMMNPTTQPTELVNNETVFQIEDDTTGDAFDAQLTFWHSPNGGNVGGVGDPQDPFNNAGFVMSLTPTGTILGDVNNDCEVNLLDVAPFVDLITEGAFQAEADINEDGIVDLLDVEPFVTLLVS
ncbi:MAG: dockerin type I domain-containing protein [Planctomycetota bacterium]